MTVLITGLVIVLCGLVRQHYVEHARQLAKVDALFATATPAAEVENPPPLDPKKPTVVFLVAASLGAGMHTLLAARKLFGDRFKNFIFVRVGEIDSASFRGEAALRRLDAEVREELSYFVNYCHRRGIAATAYHSIAADAVAELLAIADKIIAKYSDCVFLTSKLFFENDTMFKRLLHNQTALTIQRELHLRGGTVVILPMKV
jgi:hypothetical protein